MLPIPTYAQLYAGIINDLEAEFTITLPVVGKNALRVFAAVQAAKLWLFYKTLGRLQKNIFVDTADPESTGGTLERFGRVKLGRNPYPATQGQYDAEVTGTVGAVIPASTTFKSDDTSNSPAKLYILDNAFTLSTSPDTITLRALEAGIDSKLLVNDTLTATAPIAGVNAGAVVIAETVEPQAAETVEEYRTKAIAAYRSEPQGGAVTDYRLWGFDAQGVANIYPYAASGESNVINLYVEATAIDSTDGKGTPSAALLLAVEEVIELDPDTTLPISERGRRPLGVLQVNYLPISIKSVTINIASFSGITPDIQTLLFAALQSTINAIRPFVAGADILADKNDTLDTNIIIATILNARPGSVFGTITLTVAGTPTSSNTFTFGDVPYLDTITYV